MNTTPSFVHFANKSSIKVALVGNPNSGKTTLFNALTGLNQRTGNFPGVTVDKKTGTTKISTTTSVELIDLPGTYSLYPKSLDESIAVEVLCDSSNPDYPDVAVIIADASNLKRNLFLVSQIIDLKIPVILALNMMDMVEKEGATIDIIRLSERLGVKVVGISARNKNGLDELKKALLEPLTIPSYNFIDIKKIAPEVIERIRSVKEVSSDFAAFHLANTFKCDLFKTHKNEQQETIEVFNTLVMDENKMQSQESVERYKIIDRIVTECVTKKRINPDKSFTQKLDSILTHRIWGYVVFLSILFLIFQAIFFLASFPMEWIEKLFVWISEWASQTLPPGELTDLLVNGILAGLSGVVVFIPQIALLFTFISILEDTGYMARVSFIMDKLMRKFGLNGRSVIPLISGVACAVPAIMSARTIGNWKERMITIMVTPLMSCSARLPVYTLLISLVVPDDKKLAGIFNYQGLILMALYLIGFIAAILSSWAMKWILKAKEKSYFIMELPVYRSPKWNSVLLTIFDKIKIFLWEAGKIIVAISIVLWFLTSHGPEKRFTTINEKYNELLQQANTPVEELQSLEAAEKLENSYAGILGKAIEPVIKPLGFDWKIGIALITSFAAREVFVGTMATIYSAGDEENTLSIRQKMQADKDPVTGLPVFSVAVGFSLMLFYAFALQCTSTLAIVYRETKSWKWPAVQFIYMGVLAYVASYIIYHLLR